ncbi:PREDICTED: uncharacterized protein LOC109175485 [Ipomoea nil]|uniref:uncharacterized protein LOC109175485 n=1 Tax=Ipomoea nil TaxID=35883 RepID=UPI000901399A|nr:PREDICTED: uncharacterized protein LOC109175485 [Ipomoea nil]
MDHTMELKVPPKWKIFLWRALCDILPTMNNLIIRRVDVDPTCPMCGLLHEDVMHTLFSCVYSKKVWNISGLPITHVIASSFPVWLMSVMANLTKEQFGKIVAVLYHLWAARNDAMWRGLLPRPNGVWRRAAGALAAYIHANGTGHTHGQPSAPALPTLQGRPQCYFDRGYRTHSGDATYGVVLLHPDGSFKAEINGKLEGCLSPLMAEALACKKVLSWLRERNEFRTPKPLAVWSYNYSILCGGGGGSIQGGFSLFFFLLAECYF